VGLSETEAKERGIAYRLAKIPMVAVLRTRTLSETRGFLKALIDTESDRILGFTALGVEAGEIIAAVQVAMLAGLPYTALRDAIFTHPTMLEGLIPLFSAGPASPKKSRESRSDENTNDSRVLHNTRLCARYQQNLNYSVLDTGPVTNRVNLATRAISAGIGSELIAEKQNNRRFKNEHSANLVSHGRCRSYDRKRRSQPCLRV